MSNFLDKNEKFIFDQFLQEGYVIKKTNNLPELDNLQNFLVKQSSELLDKKIKSNNLEFLDNIHNFITPEKINDFRIEIINAMNNEKEIRENYYKISKKYLHIIVGNELAMQKRVNLSIQLPKDSSSLLPVHADTWSGDSPFEAVVWIPLVDCYKTKSMYILPPDKTAKLHRNFQKLSISHDKSLFEYIEKDLIWLNIKYGEILIFNQSLPHGNVVNQENETRWSLNCRFKGIFTPYNDKKLGEFFEPITLKPLSKLAMNYNLPKIKK